MDIIEIITLHSEPIRGIGLVIEGLTRLQCNPPSAVCQTLLYQYEYWGEVTGLDCLTQLRRRLDTTLNDTARQALYTSVCEGKNLTNPTFVL